MGLPSGKKSIYGRMENGNRGEAMFLISDRF
jgi:hypothetical protein